MRNKSNLHWLLWFYAIPRIKRYHSSDWPTQSGFPLILLPIPNSTLVLKLWQTDIILFRALAHSFVHPQLRSAWSLPWSCLVGEATKSLRPPTVLQSRPLSSCIGMLVIELDICRCPTDYRFITRPEPLLKSAIHWNQILDLNLLRQVSKHRLLRWMLTLCGTNLFLCIETPCLLRIFFSLST